jgi:NADH-quinone oxidoreductase subunit C
MTDATDPTPADLPAGVDVPELRHGVPVVHSAGVAVLFPDRHQLRSVVQALFDEGFLMCLDLTAVDYLTHPARTLPAGTEPERFEVVVTLLSFEARERLRLRVQVPADDPVLPSLYEIHPGTEAMEREAFDMFGLSFDGHPDLTRILMPEDWVGHPLRKDYDSGRIPVQFKGAPTGR